MKKLLIKKVSGKLSLYTLMYLTLTILSACGTPINHIGGVG